MQDGNILVADSDLTNIGNIFNFILILAGDCTTL